MVRMEKPECPLQKNVKNRFKAQNGTFWVWEIDHKQWYKVKFNNKCKMTIGTFAEKAI